MQLRDVRKFFAGLNMDDDPSFISPGEYTDAMHVRAASSTEQHGAGNLETLQGEVMVDILGESTYYGNAIGGSFIYEGFAEVLIGTQVWMKKNYDVNYPGSKVYDDDEANRAIYGGLYTWEQIMQPDFCPAGWHVPTMAELNVLLAYLAGAAVAGGKMKEPDTEHWLTPNTGADDSSGFKGLGGGKFDTAFNLLKDSGHFWLQDEEHLLDIDGNEYNVVIIGSQEWMVENLKTTKYADGSPILNLQNNGDTFDDWSLPSIDELKEMYDELHLYGLGNFINTTYWSSSEYSDVRSRIQDFTSGFQSNDMKTQTFAIHPIRAFTSVSPSYSLRDIGPAGGWIFWKSGNNYLEAASSDNEVSAWSNIDDTEIGVTAQGTAIGTGQANTTAIVGQVGHTSSAAKLCDDLVVVSPGWISDTVGAYCWYNNDITNKTPYGAMYNGYALTNAHGLITDGANYQFSKNGIPDTGWRVPSYNDFVTLQAFLGGINTAGGLLKEVGTAHWTAPNIGAIDSYGFKAVPSGERYGVFGIWMDLGLLCYFRTTTMFNATLIFEFQLQNDNTNFAPSVGFLFTGQAIRCVRDV